MHTRKWVPILLLVLLPLLVVIGLPHGPAGPSSPPAYAASEDFLSLVCPAVGGFASTLEQPNYCVYYNNPPTSDADAALVEGYVDDYWTRYDVDFGFLAPLFTAPKMEARIDGSASCNGTAWDNYIEVWDGCFDGANPEFMQYVVGHEVFHRVQFAHDPDWVTTWSNSAWLYEGTARNMEDVSFDNVDTFANCLGVAFSYCNEVNDYLASTSADITSFGMRYEANLFWTYFREQYGTTTTEPQYGVDALVELWEQMCCAESVAAVNNALAVLAPGTSFDDAFRRFTVANWTKDLTGVPDGSYNYIDEDQAGNPAPYGPLIPASGGTINATTPASFSAQFVNRYGARYYSVIPAAADCPVITVNFTRTAGSTEFYHIITQNGSAFNTHVEGRGASWTQSFLNDGVTRVVAILGGQGSSVTAGITFSCATPVIEIEQPNTGAPAYVGPFNGPDDMIVQVSVTNGSATGPIVGGLSNSDFKVEVGGLPALVTGGGFVQEEYFLLVDTPTQGANGPYDLEVFLEAPGTSTVIASDTENDAVVYDNTNTDHVIITDVSGSMGWDGKMQAAQDAANLFIDASNSTDGLGLTSYNHNLDGSLGIQFATLPHRTAAHTEVNGYIASGATSIGDGLNEAVNLLAASPTGNARCQFTLLSDGMENSALYWADVEAAVVGTGCPVMTIAFGLDSNELLMQDIAGDTGGVAYYNDVYVSAAEGGGELDDTELDLGSSYLHALCEAQNCERILSEQGIADDYGQVLTHSLMVDDSLDQLTVVLDWRPYFQIPLDGEGGYTFAMGMISPSGEVYDPDQYAFESPAAGHVAYQVDDPEAGQWALIVIYLNEVPGKKYQINAYGQTDVALNLIMPPAGNNETGDQMPIYAIWLPGGTVEATITPPDGNATTMSLHDDGLHDDGQANDGFFAGRYTLVTQAVESQPVEEEGAPNPPEPFDEGAYRVHLLGLLGDLRRETLGSFAVPEAADGNGDGIPDDYIDQYCPGAPNSDGDLDKLNCADEYYVGTDPTNSDTDGDGESDESEAIRHGLDPLNPGDDQIEAPDYVQTQAQNGSVLLMYDVKGEYDTMLTYRATNPNGPWSLVNPELPLTGEYEDGSVTNNVTYYYCVQAIDSQDHWSAVVCSEAVTPRVDPILPEAAVLINGGQPTTNDPHVLLSFVPSDEGHEEGFLATADSFDDITEVMISNNPLMTGAVWQPFEQDIPWQLAPGGGIRTVYVRFKDVNGNESAGVETASIFVEGGGLYLPIIVNK